MFVPQQGWQYTEIGCKTLEVDEDNQTLPWYGQPCVFPFKDWSGQTHFGCEESYYGPVCYTKVDDRGNGGYLANCAPDCPKHPNALTTDDTLKVTHHAWDQKEIMLTLKLFGIMALSLFLIGLMFEGLGITGSEMLHI